MTPAPAPRASIPTRVPWASADEEAAKEPVGAVIAVRRTGIRIVRVVAPGADRWSGNIDRCRIINHWTDTDTHGNLRMSKCRRHYENRKQSKGTQDAQSKPPRQAAAGRSGQPADVAPKISTFGEFRNPTYWKHGTEEKLRRFAALKWEFSRLWPHRGAFLPDS